jgi:uncharacterized membrane protein YfcA
MMKLSVPKIVLLVAMLLSAPSLWAEDGGGVAIALYGWIVILFFTTLFLGVIAVLGGVGGAVLYVPIMASFFPFGMDFVRCSGLIIALAGALSAAPNLIRRGYVSFRLAFPAALVASAFAIVGAMVGLALPASAVQVALGTTILMIALLLALARKSNDGRGAEPDRLARMLRLEGRYYELSSEREVEWKAQRVLPGLAVFSVVGFIGGMFGLGAGWANVPLFNLFMGVPIKVSVASSVFLMSVSGAAGAWVYVSKGALLPALVLPSVIGMMLGTNIGSKILPRVKPRLIRYLVILLLVVAAVQSILKGLRG